MFGKMYFLEEFGFFQLFIIVIMRRLLASGSVNITE